MSIGNNDLHALLTESLKRHNVPGASLAVFYEGALTTAAAGVINASTGVELTPETVMLIGSIAKIFNTTLIMQLVDEGKVDLDERVLRYLPDLKLKDREALEQITVKMLLNHTSGIDGNMLPDHGHDEETIEKGIARFANLEQLFRPGTEYSYCNAAAVIAGYLAQQLREKSWYSLVRERIFEPLNMEHAVTLPEEALLHRASVGHYLNPANQQVARTSFAFLPLSFSPGGTTLTMSARDLITFARAHMRNGVGANGVRILSERSVRAMQTMTVNNKGNGYTFIDGVGLGWMVSDDGLLYHSGGGPGIVAVLYVHPEREFAAAVLTNAEHGGTVVNEFMEPWLKEIGTIKPVGMTDVHVPLEPVNVDPNNYVGVYANVSRNLRISQTSAGLAISTQENWSSYENMSTAATPPAHLIPLGDEKFLKGDGSSRNAGRVIAFRNPNTDGHMQHLGAGGLLYKRVS